MSKTTLLGSIGAVLMGLQINYDKLAAGDRGEICKLLVALVIGLSGYYQADRPQSADSDPVEKRETKGVTPGTDSLK